VLAGQPLVRHRITPQTSCRRSPIRRPPAKARPQFFDSRWRCSELEGSCSGQFSAVCAENWPEGNLDPVASLTDALMGTLTRRHGNGLFGRGCYEESVDIAHPVRTLMVPNLLRSTFVDDTPV